jgi:hypothetical protein
VALCENPIMADKTQRPKLRKSDLAIPDCKDLDAFVRYSKVPGIAKIFWLEKGDLGNGASNYQIAADTGEKEKA